MANLEKVEFMELKALQMEVNYLKTDMEAKSRQLGIAQSKMDALIKQLEDKYKTPFSNKVFDENTYEIVDPSAINRR